MTVGDTTAAIGESGCPGKGADRPEASGESDPAACRSSDPLFHIVLVEPEIPQNAGTIGRLCLGVGCRLHLVEPLGFRIDEKAVRRAGLDYWKHVDLEVHESFAAVRAALGATPLTLTSAREGRLFTAHRFTKGEVLVFGPESVGLRAAWRAAHPGRVIRVPTLDTIRSLNLSQAVAVVVYEGIKQLRPDFFR